MTCMQRCRAFLREEYSTKLGWKMTDDEWEIMTTMARLPGHTVQHSTKQMWIICKIAAALFGVAAVLLTLIDYGTSWVPFGQLFIFLTYLTQIFEGIYLVSSCFFCMKLLKHDEENSDFGKENRQHWAMVSLWILQHIIFVCALAVTILFWALVYDGEDITALVQVGHIYNTIVLLPDYFFSQLPFRFLHGWLPIAYGLLYIVLSAILYVAGVGSIENDTDYIYSSLDWDNISKSIINCVGILIGVLVLHCILYCVSMVTLPRKATEEKLEVEMASTSAKIV